MNEVKLPVVTKQEIRMWIRRHDDKLRKNPIYKKLFIQQQMAYNIIGKMISCGQINAKQVCYITELVADIKDCNIIKIIITVLLEMFCKHVIFDMAVFNECISCKIDMQEFIKTL